MMKRLLCKTNFMKIIVFGLVICVVAGVIIRNNFKVEASSEYIINEKNNIDTSKYMDFVRFNESNKKFEITNEGYNRISKEEVVQIEQIISETNEIVKYIDIDSDEVTIIDCDNYKNIDNEVTRKKYKEGKNDIKIDFHLVTVKLSKTTVNTIGTGVSIAGIWIPEALVSKVVSSLGIIGCACPGGIWFTVSLTTLFPPMTIASAIVFTRAGFQ